MTPEQVAQMIEQGLAGCEVRVTGDGSHFEAVVIGTVFEGKSMVEEQKMVYATLGDSITSGALHALSIKAYTPEEWEKAQKLQVSGS